MLPRHRPQRAPRADRDDGHGDQISDRHGTSWRGSWCCLRAYPRPRAGRAPVFPGVRRASTPFLVKSVDSGLKNSGPRVQVREIEIFLTLAEELHFSRTAERLCISPGRVTQAVKKQERLIAAPSSPHHAQRPPLLSARSRTGRSRSATARSRRASRRPGPPVWAVAGPCEADQRDGVRG
ncbi:LysR family transcriptional regulator [Streptomyces sp. NPDC002566]|uniref:helix-turn-helix domain-containing protein n=1 Tax=Streptomyces sp. NPDC002566 TaxID=3364650 RepID=UPI0036835484